MGNSKNQARITLYKITEMGLYRNGEEKPEFNDLSIFLKDLKNWVKNKTLKETCTYASLEDEDLNKTFCYDIKESTQGNYLLITWNKVASYSNGVATVSGTSKVGEANIQTTNYSPDDIPGIPTYFWIMPSKNRFATLNFDFAQNGRQDLHKYLREFFSKWSRYVVDHLDNQGVRNIVRWEDPADSSRSYTFLRGKFDSKLIVNPGKIQYLLNNWEDIRKVYQHNEMSIAEVVQLPKIAKIGKFLGMNCAPKTNPGIKFKLEADMTFNSQEELSALIEDWEKNTNLTKWENLGFGMLGNTQKPIWLGESRANDYFDCPLEKDKNQIFKSDDLVVWLDSITHNVLKLEESSSNDNT